MFFGTSLVIRSVAESHNREDKAYYQENFERFEESQNQTI
jgi:hypothetical protein